jgi:hypothetical protein
MTPLAKRLFVSAVGSALALAFAPQTRAQAPAARSMTARDYYAELGNGRRLNTTWGDAYVCFDEDKDDTAFFVVEAQFRDIDEHGKVAFSFGPSNYKKHSNPADDDDTQLLVSVTIDQKGVSQGTYLGARQSTADDVVTFTFTMRELRDWARLSLTPGTWRYHLELAGHFVEWFGGNSSQKKADEHGQCELVPERWRKPEAK